MVLERLESADLNWPFMNNTCRHCGSSNTELLFSNDLDFDFCQPFEQRICQCKVCGVICTTQSVGYDEENLNQYYSHVKRTPCDLNNLDDSDPRVINADSRLFFIREFINEGKLLEAGCGDGVSLFRASKKSNFEVTGVDSSFNIRWSFQFRFNNLMAPYFLKHKLPNSFTYKPSASLLDNQYPKELDMVNYQKN